MSEEFGLTRETLSRLGQPFGAGELEFLAKAASNGRALALPFIDARCVMNRLDEVVGPMNWQFTFDPLTPDCKKVRGALTVCGVTKCDAGEASAEDEPLKSACSDALKRCAVHFNIARYLYALPPTWTAYDQGKRRFTETPQIDPRAVAAALRSCGVTLLEPSVPPRVMRAVQGGEQDTYAAATVGQETPEQVAAKKELLGKAKARIEAMKDDGRDMGIVIADLCDTVGFRFRLFSELNRDQLTLCVDRLEALASKEEAAA